MPALGLVLNRAAVQTTAYHAPGLRPELLVVEKHMVVHPVAGVFRLERLLAGQVENSGRMIPWVGLGFLWQKPA